MIIKYLADAFEARQGLMRGLAAEQTDCYRLFQGSVEGLPGLTVDRYADLILVQSFHQPLPEPALTDLRAYYAQALPGLDLLYNDRSSVGSRISNRLDESGLAIAHNSRSVREMGIQYQIQGRHGGQDPWLFLDARAARRRIAQLAPGKSLLNLFAYTCASGIVAARHGASHVVNVNFAESSLSIGKENARLNDLPVRPRFVKSDAFPAMRQYAGLGQAERMRGKQMPSFPKLEARQFDLVYLDPPHYAKSPFGVVDLVNDYPGVFKPALLCTAPGGTLICCNNVAAVDREAWLSQLERSAAKAGRPIQKMEWLTPEADFPSPDGKPPLKIAVLDV